MIIKNSDLLKIRKENENKKIVLCSGWFDLFHVGHLNFLKEAKKQGDILIVNIRNDCEGRIIKGEKRPVINEMQRQLIVDSLKFVDYTILSEETFSDIKNANRDELKELFHWKTFVTKALILKPDVVFSIEETFKDKVFEDVFSCIGAKLIIGERTDGISTSSIELQIKEDFHLEMRV